MASRRRATLALAALLASAAVALGGSARAERIAVPAGRDATLVEDAYGALANGAGPYLFVGRTSQTTGSRRRAALWFDVSAHVPDGARVTSATLVLYASDGHEAPADLALQRLLADWEEGPASASGGRGAPATAGDATWLYAAWPDVAWATPGGDAAAPPSATAAVAGSGEYSWSSPQLAADVRGWLADPASNRGWLLSGGEGAPSTAKKLDSREHPDPARHPLLEIEFERRESECTAAGYTGGALALCTAYCEALDCDAPPTRAAARACEQLEAGFRRATGGGLLPCPDSDRDGVKDDADVCPLDPDPAQSDLDGDGVGDACDNCVLDPNPGQEDGFGTPALGDACDCPCFTATDAALLLGTLSDASTYTDPVCIDTRVSQKPLTALQSFRLDGASCASETLDCSALALRFTEDAVCQWNPPAPDASFTVQGISGAQREACRQGLVGAGGLFSLRCN